jgi:hypothetical protein
MHKGVEEVDPSSTFAVGVRVFTRLLGLTFAVAFLSFGVQAAGLLGEAGIQPLARLVEWDQLDATRAFLDMPTLFWLGQSDGLIGLVWITGALAGLAATFGVAQRSTLLLATACWLSFSSLAIPPDGSQGLGFAFLGYAWDGLLVELGLVAVLVAPRRVGAGESSAPTFIAVLALRVLLFRIVFGAAVAPYLLGDGSWSETGALARHLWTTPVPSWPGLVAAGTSDSLLGVVDFISELASLVVVFGIFGPRGVRNGALLALLAVSLVQVVFVPRGVYPLAVVSLILACFDDRAFARFRLASAKRAVPPGIFGRVASGLLAVHLAVGVYVMVSDLGRRDPSDVPSGFRLALGRWQVANHYAPVLDVPDGRPALTILGTADLETWEPLDLKTSPRDPFRAPSTPSLHLRRLDWAMDRAARQIQAGGMPPAWLVRTLVGLLEGRADVRALFDDGPFEGQPPRALRLELHELTPAPSEERGVRDMWWYRQPGQDVGAPVMAEDGQLVPAKF